MVDNLASDASKTAIQTAKQNLAGTHLNLADAYKDLGEKGEARRYYEMAVALFEDTPKPEHWSTAHCMQSLAAFLEKEGDFGEAVLRLKRGLEICKIIYIHDHRDTIMIRDTIARLEAKVQLV